jgi:hypothetical protein
MNTEIWKTIEGFNNYQVSNLGRILSVRTGKIRKQFISNKGYPRVGIFSNENKQYTMVTHRIVAKAFIETIHNKLEVNHIDGNKLNNTVSNLEWCDSSENQKHAFRLGLQIPIANGENHFNSKLSEWQVSQIRKLCKTGTHQRDIAKLFNICQQNVSIINMNKTWGHVVRGGSYQ